MNVTRALAPPKEQHTENTNELDKYSRTIPTFVDVVHEALDFSWEGKERNKGRNKE
jgi:hypothetical protein